MHILKYMYKQLMFHTPKFKLNVVPNVNLKTKDEDFPE